MSETDGSRKALAPRGATRERRSYGAIAKAFHWIMFLGVAGMFPLGYVMADMRLSPQKLQIISWHKSFGIVLLLLVLLRLGWRVASPPPALPDAIPWRERTAARSVHALLYVCLFALPISGWFMSSAAGLPIVVFKAWQLPDPIGADEGVRLALFATHKIIGFCLLALLAVHVAAALFHHYLRRDDILMRMLPFGLRKRASS